jgi:hypothetical protein
MTSGIAYTTEEMEAKKAEIVQILAEGVGTPFYAACQKAGVGISTAYEWREADETFDRTVIVARKQGYENAVDFAENKLMKLINDEEKREHGKSVRFFLETRGKDRGYSKRAEITGKNGAPLHTPTAPTVQATDEEALAAATEIIHRQP